jgi:Predicted Fe-S oxidoreductases
MVNKNICWSITNECGYNCIFCHSFVDAIVLPIDKNMEILKKLISYGVRKITWSGGDPLKYEGIYDLIKYAKSNNIITGIDVTSIDVTEEVLKFFSSYIDLLILPLDASSNELHENLGKSDKHYDRIINILEFRKKNNYKFKLRINSVATEMNRHDFDNLYEIVNKYGVDIWRIYRFIPLRGVATKNKEKLEICDDEWHKITNKYTHKDFRISFCDNKELQNENYVIKPNGDLIHTKNYKDILIENLL